MNERLILAGFMGTGKTTVGQLCAQRLGYDFVDADKEIERREGLPIPRIFEQKGENYFRSLEATLVQELVKRPRVVIATGGGMLVNETNRQALLNAGITICLTASPEAILQRVDASTRPMLRTSAPPGDGQSLRERIVALAAERAPAYRALHYAVDTSNRSPEEVAQCAVAIYTAEHRRISVQTSGTPVTLTGEQHSRRYDIILGEQVIDQLGFALAGRGWSAPFAIVTDDVVGPCYAERVQQALACAGIDSFIHIMPAGENSKNLHSVEAMYQAFSEHGMERNSAVIAVGGGVVGDATGFAAATYLRGVPFVQAPTSLLAMADSSVGGKVGVDTPFGKNLVGAFKQPELVMMDIACLRSLLPIELRSGYAEIIKAALISGGDAYERVLAGAGVGAALPNPGDNRLVATLVDAVELKRAVVEEDPFEKGRRAVLNLGHTFGHGIETWSRYRIKHGEAVALGVVCAARLSQALNLCDKERVREIISILGEAGLPTALPGIDVDVVWQLMQSDKKKRAGKLRFVLIRAPGDIVVTDAVSEVQAREALAGLDMA